MLSQRSRHMRCRQCPCQPRPRRPPNRMRLSSRSPSACQYSSRGPRNSSGTSEFHSSITSSESSARTATTAASTATPFTDQRTACRISVSSSRQPFVPGRPEPLAQITHGVTFPCQQRVDAQARALCQLAKADTLQLVRDEDFALLGGQLRERRLDLREQNSAHHRSVGSIVGCRQQVLEAERNRIDLARCTVSALTRMGLGSAAPEAIDDAIARNPREPCPRLLHWLHHPVGHDQFVKRLLQDVLRFRRIRDRAADVGQQPPALAPHRGGNVTVLLREADGFAERSLHLPDKTFEPAKYCRQAPAARCGTGKSA